MSRQTIFNLNIPRHSKAPIVLRIKLQSSTESQVSVNRAYNRRPVSQIYVQTESDDIEKVTPTEVSQIARIVKWGELEQAIITPEKIINIGKYVSTLPSFDKSSDMTVQGVVSTCNILPYMISDSHYFVYIKPTDKTKIIPIIDKQIYSIIFQYLSVNNLYMVVRFVSYPREKFGIIYPDRKPDTDIDDDIGDDESFSGYSCLRMSILIHSNYHRINSEKILQKFDSEVLNSHIEKIFGTSYTEFDIDDKSSYTDSYEINYKDLVDRVISGELDTEPIDPIKKQVKLSISKPKIDIEADPLSLLLA